MPTPDALPFPPIPALVSSYSMQCNHWHVRSRKSPHILLKYIPAQVRDSNASCSLDMTKTKHCLSKGFTFISCSLLRNLSSKSPTSFHCSYSRCLFVCFLFEHAGILWVFCVWEHFSRTTSVQPFPYWVTDSQERETDHGAQRVQTNDFGVIMVPLWAITPYKEV